MADSANIEPRTSSDGRGRRVVLLLVLLWLLNGFDLLLTIMANQLADFNEANPLARLMLAHPYGVIAFKIGAVAFASAVMIVFRRHRVVELACWGVCMVYVVLAVVWMSFLVRYGHRTESRPPTSFGLPVKFKRPPRQEHRLIAPDVDQQPQGDAIDQ